MSPEINFSSPGISIVSDPQIELGKNQVFSLFGSFAVSKQVASEFDDHLLHAIVILLRGPFPATLNVGTDQLLFKDDLFEVGENVCGYFNLDLFEFFNLLKVPNRYYVSASIFEYVSNIIAIEVV